MTPLLKHISERRLAKTAITQRLLDAGRKLPVSAHRALEKNLWPFKWSHMRSMAEGIRFRPMNDGGWEIEVRGRVLARSKPFSQLARPLGKPVSVVASGPSAADYPWDQAKDGGRFLIAVNGSPSFLGQMGLLPDLLVVTDSEFIRKSRHHLKNAGGVPLVTTHREASILAVESPEYLLSRDFTIIERVDAWYGVPAIGIRALSALNASSHSPFHFPSSGLADAKVGWSNRPDLGFFSSRTVAFSALQIAVGLQAKHIEVIGMDLGGSGRSYAEGSKAQPSFLEMQYDRLILPSFEIMHRALEGTDVRIRNLSPVCPLPRDLFAT